MTHARRYTEARCWRRRAPLGRDRRVPELRQSARCVERSLQMLEQSENEQPVATGRENERDENANCHDKKIHASPKVRQFPTQFLSLYLAGRMTKTLTKPWSSSRHCCRSRRSTRPSEWETSTASLSNTTPNARNGKRYGKFTKAEVTSSFQAYNGIEEMRSKMPKANIGYYVKTETLQAIQKVKSFSLLHKTFNIVR